MLVLDDEFKALTVQSLVTFHASLVPLTVAFHAWVRLAAMLVLEEELKALTVQSLVTLYA